MHLCWYLSRWNHVPSLRDFSFGSINVDIHKSCGSQIRGLNTQISNPTFEPIQLFRQVSELLLLESLALFGVFKGSDWAATLSTPIHLQNPRHLEVTDNGIAYQSLFLLGNVTVKPGSRLRLEAGLIITSTTIH